MLEQLTSSDFKGALADQRSLIIHANKIKSTDKALMLREPFLTLPSVLYVTKNFYLIDTLNEELENIKSCGLMKLWQWKYVDKDFEKVEVSKQPKVIEVQHLLGCFQILIWGLFLSSLIFALEILSRKCDWKRFFAARNILRPNHVNAVHRRPLLASQRLAHQNK